MSFTSAALSNLAIRTLRRIDPSLVEEDVRAPDDYASATSSAVEKRSVLVRALERGGPSPILAVGEALGEIANVPTLRAMLASENPTVLAKKWMRLEQYNHSSHRTLIKAEDHSWDCQRQSTGEPQHEAENLLIFGVQMGLLRLFGCEGVIGDMAGFIVGNQPVADLSPAHPSDHWTIRWQSTPVADRVEISGAREQEPVEDRVCEVLSSDLARNWEIAAVARRLGRSARSLQRDIRNAGRTYSSIVRVCRSREASRLLAQSDWSLADIGYWCGYSDQAHFQRDFRRALNMTPLNFRRL